MVLALGQLRISSHGERDKLSTDEHIYKPCITFTRHRNLEITLTGGTGSG